MKRRILTVCLLLALLLTACGGQNREPENPPDAKPSAPWEEAAEPPDETPEPEPAKPEEKEPLSLEAVLTDIYTVAPGTAGSSAGHLCRRRAAGLDRCELGGAGGRIQVDR